MTIPWNCWRNIFLSGTTDFIFRINQDQQNQASHGKKKEFLVEYLIQWTNPRSESFYRSIASVWSSYRSVDIHTEHRTCKQHIEASKQIVKITENWLRSCFPSHYAKDISWFLLLFLIPLVESKILFITLRWNWRCQAQSRFDVEHCFAKMTVSARSAAKCADVAQGTSRGVLNEQHHQCLNVQVCVFSGLPSIADWQGKTKTFPHIRIAGAIIFLLVFYIWERVFRILYTKISDLSKSRNRYYQLWSQNVIVVGKESCENSEKHQNWEHWAWSFETGYLFARICCILAGDLRSWECSFSRIVFTWSNLISSSRWGSR